MAVLFALIHREPTRVIIPFQQGLFPFIGWQDLEQGYPIAQFMEKLRNSTYVSISVGEIVREVIADQDFAFVSKEMQMLSEDEAEVLRLLKEDQLLELTVRMKNGKVTLIEATQEVKDPSTQTRLIDLIASDGYQDISFTTQNGKVVKFLNTTKHKLRK